MSKIYILLLASLLLCFLDTARAQEWQTVETFSGEGITNTEAFNMNESEWRVVYKSEATGLTSESDGAGHIFQLYLEQPNDEFSMDILANQANKRFIDGKSSVYKSGRFYFKVNASSAKWEIKIQVPSETQSYTPNQSISSSVGDGQIDATNYQTMMNSLDDVDNASKERQQQFVSALLKIIASKMDMLKIMEIGEAENNGNSANEILVDMIRDEVHGKTVSEMIILADNLELDETQEKMYQILKNSMEF